jgi:hypothetical protein
MSAAPAGHLRSILNQVEATTRRAATLRISDSSAPIAADTPPDGTNQGRSRNKVMPQRPMHPQL